ncbi:MAG: Rap1a/Tai family immunity protein [Gallionellaceae bacterium]|nr:Rap1a/Tai family immunity protein [Gallionellaceae bacterium]
MKKYRLAAILAALVPAVAGANVAGHAIQTGEGLAKMCNGADKVKALSMMCHSYLNGYIDAAMHYDSGGRFCLGTGDKQRLPVVVITWLNAHPDHMKKPAPEALGKLLAENYPCRK